MESPGKFLKRERETRSISLEEISNFTKIKEHHLKAIEEDRYEALPAALYVKGFLTGYARYLALNPKDVLLQYETYLKSLMPPEPVVLPPQGPPKKKVRQWLLFSLLLAAIISVTFIILNPTRRPAEKKSQALSIPIIPSQIKARLLDQPQPSPILELQKSDTDMAKELILAINVLEAGIGTGVEKDGVQQSLTGKCSSFRSNHQRGYFFTRIKTPKAGKIAHIWSKDGKECYRMEIDVKPPSWSVYSYFTFRPEHAGNWKAEAREGDRTLTSLNFNVVQTTEERSL